MLAVEVLVQAVVVAGAVLQQQRRGLGLPGGVAASKEFSVIRRKARRIADRTNPLARE